MWRMRQWIYFKDGYKTKDLSFMERVWWVFPKLFEKGLVYKGFRSVIFVNWLIKLVCYYYYY